MSNNGSASKDPHNKYQKCVMNEIFVVCKESFNLLIPNPILSLITKYFSLQTEILSSNEIKWICNKVIPNHCLAERLYYVSPNDTTAFKKYNSFSFHNCVDEKGPTVFIIDCKWDDNNKGIIIGGYCDQSWFSPYKRGKDKKTNNGAYTVKGSTECELFVLRNDELTKKLTNNHDHGYMKNFLPLLAERRNEHHEDIMHTANRDGPNFGFNNIYVTANGTITGYTDRYKTYFRSPIPTINSLLSFMLYKHDDVNSNHEYERCYVVRMEVFTVIHDD